MGISRKIQLSAVIISLILGLGLFIGCSENPTSSSDTISQLSPELNAADSSLDRSHGLIDIDVSVAGNTISSSTGGTIDINIGTGETAQFIVPSNSIDKNTRITIKAREIRVPGKTVFEFTFGPCGLEFSTPARLVLNASAFNDEDIKYVNWYYFNPKTFRFELVDRIDVVDGQVVIPVSHFSKYLGISQGGQ